MGIDGESKTSFNTNYTVFMKNKYTYFHMRKKKMLYYSNQHILIQ